MFDNLFLKWIKAFLVFIITLIVIGACITTIRNANADELEKCSPYREQVEIILKSEAVSIDYYYLMVAESRCTDKAVSVKGALGFWQLMPATGKHYGCSNLHDIECSTRAAARYIRHLQSQFKHFEDVIMAYNMGGHNYRRYGATKQAKGLLYTVKRMMKNDNQ